MPVLNAILPSNQVQIERGIKMVMESGSNKIGVLDFSFKAGTDDLRESPMIEVVERLLGKGYDLRLFDRHVTLAKLVGANRDYILNRIPHIVKLMANSVEEVTAHADTLIVGTKETEFISVLDNLRPEQKVLDFVRIVDRHGKSWCDGICW